VGEGLGQPTKPQHTPTTATPSHIVPIPTVTSSSQPKKTHTHKKTKRKATKISRSSGPTILIVDETVYEERGDIVQRVTTNASRLEAEQDSGSGPRSQDTILGDRAAQTRYERLSKQSHEPPLSRVNILGSREDIMKLMELMELCTKLSDMVLDLETVKDAQALEINKLKKRVKKMESRKKSRISQLKRRLFKFRLDSSSNKNLEDAETQGMHGQDTEVNTASAPVTTAGVSISTAKPLSPQQQLNPKDKGKGIMQEPDKPLKKKDQIALNEEVVRKLEAQMQAKLEEEERLTRQKEEEANITLIESWDNTQAMMDVDYELAARLQEEERGDLTIE
nr:hypothetical protein [Tanacetum cinerariifolium]